MQDGFDDSEDDQLYERPGDREPLPEECSLPFDEQIKNLKAAYSDPAFEKHPLLPPYSSEEISAMEAKYSISFPPLLRYYIENISRETSFTFYRSLVQPRDFDLWYRVNEMTLDEHYEAKGKQRALEPPTWYCHVAQHGCGYDETIWFSGRLRGFVQFAEDMYYPHIRTLYERMIESDPSDGSIEKEDDDDVIFPTLEETPPYVS